MEPSVSEGIVPREPSLTTAAVQAFGRVVTISLGACLGWLTAGLLWYFLYFLVLIGDDLFSEGIATVRTAGLTMGLALGLGIRSSPLWRCAAEVLGISIAGLALAVLLGFLGDWLGVGRGWFWKLILAEYFGWSVIMIVVHHCRVASEGRAFESRSTGP